MHGMKSTLYSETLSPESRSPIFCLQIASWSLIRDIRILRSLRFTKDKLFSAEFVVSILVGNTSRIISRRLFRCDNTTW